MSAVSTVKDERSEINTSGTLLGIPSGAEHVFPYWAEGIVWYTAVFRTVLWHTPQSPLIIVFETTDSCSRYTTEIMSKYNSNRNHSSLGKNRNLVFWIHTSTSLQTNRRDSRDLLGTPLVQAGFWMLVTRYALRLYYIGTCTCTELPRNTVVQPFLQALKEYSRRAKPRYNQFGKCIGGLWVTINLVTAQFCPQATVPIPGTSTADIALPQSQGVCCLASCSDLYSDTKLRLSMPTLQPTLVLLPWSVLRSQQLRY